MKEAWEVAHDDAAVKFWSFRRDGLLLLSGALAGLAATLCSLVFHAIAGIALKTGPVGFLRWIATAFTVPATPFGIGGIVAAFGLVLLTGTALGVLFALVADRLHDRNSILGAGIAYGFGLFALLVFFGIRNHVVLGLPVWELLTASLFYGGALVTQQAIMDLLEPYAPRTPARRREEGPIRLPTLGPAT